MKTKKREQDTHTRTEYWRSCTKERPMPLQRRRKRERNEKKKKKEK